jgi:hypothetical protein
VKRLIFVACAFLLTAAFSGATVVDTAWQNQFVGAVNWSTLGITADGTTDNTLALDALPGGTAIIGDCPAGSTINFGNPSNNGGIWYWPNNLTVWQQPGCWLKYTGTNINILPIQNTGGFGSTTSTTGVQYYGMNFEFATPTPLLRVFLGWFDHWKFKYFNIVSSGGFGVIRGSDQEIAYGTLSGVTPSAGNPGIRLVGNVPKVPTSPGMHANVWIHGLYFESGDSPFQTCQPNNNTISWAYGISTDDVMYEGNYGISDASALILVNAFGQGGPNFTCRNITYRNTSGKGLWYASIGNATVETSNITVTGGVYDGSLSIGSSSPVLGIGNWPIGGTSPTVNTFNVSVNNVTISNANYLGVGVLNSQNVSVNNVTIGPMRGAGVTSSPILVRGSTNVVVENSTVNVTVAKGGITVGDSGAINTNIQLLNNTVNGVRPTYSGFFLGNATGVTATGNIVTPRNSSSGGYGISLTTDPNGTHNSIVTGNDVSAMPAGQGVVCAPGQGNSVTGNTGATDCAP